MKLAEASKISPGEIERRDLAGVGEAAGKLLAQHRAEFDEQGSALIFATMLGFLIDELVARYDVKNGMGFWYRFAFAALSGLGDRLPALKQRMRSLRIDVDALQSGVESLAQECNRFGGQAGSRQVADQDWKRRAEATADQLRSLGFKLRQEGRLNNEEADSVFSASNAIWRWVFFLEQRSSYEELKALGQTAAYRERVAEGVLRWLRRPWGIVTVADIDRAFRGLVLGDENDGVPRAFGALTPFLRSELEQYLAENFGVTDAERARHIMRRLIGHRHLLHLCRHNIERVRSDEAQQRENREQAAVLVELFTHWIYDLAEEEVRERIQSDLSEIAALLRSADWLRHAVQNEEVARTFSVRQREVVNAYLEEPEAFISRLFRFDESDFRIEESIGLMPPEKFTFRPRS